MGGNFKFSGGAEEINTEGIQNQDSVFLSAEETKPLQAGSKVPAVELNTINGEIFNLREEIAKNPSILIFYRGGWCPYCNMQLGQLKDIEETLIGMGYRILAISVDKPEKLRETLDKYEMKYRLLSDSRMEASKAFGIAFKVNETVLSKSAKFGATLESFSGETHHLLPVPSVFITGTDMVIKYVYSNPDFKIRIKPDILLAEAKKALERK